MVKNKWWLFFITIICVLCINAPPFLNSEEHRASAATGLIHLEYVLPDKGAILINSPNQLEQIKKWIISEDQTYHTGWSAEILKYDDTKDRIGPDGKISHWHQDILFSTQNGLMTYSPTMFKNEIISEHGNEVYQAILASGQRFKAKSQTIEEYQIYEYDPRIGAPSPKNGDISFTYRENKVIVYLDIDLSSSPGGGGGTTPSPPGSCSRDFVSTGNGSSINNAITSASPSGSISSNTGEFNVVQGIPSSEFLRADASSEEYLFNNQFLQRTGNVVFNNVQAKKTFVLTWTEETQQCKDGTCATVYTPMSETVTVEESVGGITRPYSYWEIQKFDVWKLDGSLVTNYALPGSSVSIPASTSVSANASHSPAVENHVFPSDCVEVTLPIDSIDGGKTKPSLPSITAEAKAMAESAIGQNQVQNDSATFKGSTIMSNSRVSVNGPTPTSIPSPSRVSMSRTGLQIDPLKTNYWQSPSSGNVNFSVLVSVDNSASNKSFSFAVNNVTVHTPTVIYATSSDDKEHDQRTNPPARSTPTNSDTERHAYVLDRPFTVSLPTTGQHRNIPGYGQRDYSKYIKGKQVKFPFDVYSETKQVFYPANTWINVPVNIETVNFFMPVWVPEGEYTVEFRSLAINALSSGDFGGSEPEANVTIPNGNVEGHQSAAHVATDTIKVDVIGRLYDFQVTDITDYNWQSVFRESDGVTPTGNSYWVGLNGIDGDPRGNTSLFTLPIRQGSHSEGYKNVATKTGYTFKFDLKTKGDMFSSTDGIRIKPTFYFVNKDGTNRQKVDLYYHNEEDYFVKIGSEDDKVYREVELNQTLRNVPESELIANADYYYRHASNYGLEDTVDDYYATSFSRQYIKRISKEDVITGPYSWQILNWNLRTFIGPEENEVPSNTMVPAEDIVAKEQTWYGEYSLPANVYVTAKNTSISDTALLGSLNENHLSFLRDGYIIVNFDIETIQEGDLNNPYLQYINGGLMNQWSDMEGYQHSFVDPYGYTFNLLDGDVIFYHGDQNSEMDFNSSVTH